MPNVDSDPGFVRFIHVVGKPKIFRGHSYLVIGSQSNLMG